MNEEKGACPECGCEEVDHRGLWTCRCPISPMNRTTNKIWIETIDEKIRELEMIATWASIVHYGNVRDSIRVAISQLKQHKDAGE